MSHDNDDKKSKIPNLVLLKSLKESEDEINLDDNEIIVKEKLLNIENKLASMEKVIVAINNEKSDTIFNSNAFNLLVGSIAISAAVNVVAEYFGIDPKHITNLLE